MRPTLLDPPAKEALRKAVRSLRPKLLEEILDAARGEYQLDLPIEKTKLPEASRHKRKRLEAWLDEQGRTESLAAATKGGKAAKGGKGAKANKGDTAAKAPSASAAAKGAHGSDTWWRHLRSAVKEAAHTLLNRLVLVRILEHHEVLSPAVVTGGWKSPAYDKEYTHYARALMGDDSRGYQALLDVVFADLSLELPGLFGPVGLTALFPVFTKTLRAVIDMLNDPALANAWGDDTTLGWVYQYWNDPERELLDQKIAGGGKIEPHEIASKTQMFTERYMVEWLLQNSLGPTWLSICKKNGWTAEAELVLPVLDARRAEFRAKREKGEVPQDALMPVEEGLESAWKYHVPQPLPEDAAEKARASIREVKLLDPACGSGHFLVIAFDLLAGLYEEEARHRGVTWTAAEIAESIVANNLYGIDIDPRAIQMAAAGLWLKAKLAAPGAELRRMNLVAPAFRLASLPKDDPALGTLIGALKELRIPPEMTRRLVEGLSGVDYLGTLLRVDRLIGEVVEQGPLLAAVAQEQREALDTRVAEFLDAHAAESDLGLRLGGEQVAAGLRFLGMVKEGTYDVVVGNPPYQGLSKTEKFGYVVTAYPRGKADLYAAFLERGLELVLEGGISAMVTMRGWMFMGQFAELREAIARSAQLCFGDLGWGAFEAMTDNPVAMVVATKTKASRARSSVAISPTDPTGRVRTDEHRRSLQAGLLVQVGRYEFDPERFSVIDGEPIVYWWTRSFLERYATTPKLGQRSHVRQGMATTDNQRYLRRPWEVPGLSIIRIKSRTEAPLASVSRAWAPTIQGGEDRAWLEPLLELVRWAEHGLELKVLHESKHGSFSKRVQSQDKYFVLGVAFSMIGSHFRARAHRVPSVFGNKGSSVFPDSYADRARTLCAMNRSEARAILEGLNPGIGFEVGDVMRLPVSVVHQAEDIVALLVAAFDAEERSREPSVEFKSPGPSPWKHAQAWAQLAVDRAEGAPLPPYVPEYEPPNPEAPVSFALGVALGRFGANGEGVLDTAPPTALPAGILFVGPGDDPDSLQHPATAPVLAAWEQHRKAIAGTKKPPSLRDYLRKDFFAYHKALYENRPIHFPLSSPNRTFVAWVNIHRWTDNTLQTLLADHLHPLLRKLDGQIKDVNAVRTSPDKKIAGAAEDHYATLHRLRTELAKFIEDVTTCAERGAPPTDPACKPRDADAPFVMDLDDGVMINAAALWPLLAPQWNDPAKWWKQICQPDGRKDYDWSHLARRYFPTRVDQKCQSDPSLAVAHTCFWKYHPAKAYAWELRLQDEIRPDFTLDEPDSIAHREAFLTHHPDQARDLRAAEEKRRDRKARKQEDDDPGEADGAPDDGDSD